MMVSTISFTHQRKKKAWKIMHNLNEYGMDIEAAFINWSARTMVFKAKDFCKYVVSKDPTNFKCEPV